MCECTKCITRKIFRKISVKSAVMYCCFREKFLFLKCLTNAPHEFWISGLDVYSCELHLWHRPTKCQWTHLSSIDIKNFYDFSQRIPLLANHQVIWNTLKSDENCCLKHAFSAIFQNEDFREQWVQGDLWFNPFGKSQKNQIINWTIHTIITLAYF